MPEIICSQCGKPSEIDSQNQTCQACGKKFTLVDIARAVTKDGLAKAAKILAERPKNRIA